MKNMEIIHTNPENGNPVVDVHEYRDVLAHEQTLNHKEVFEYFASVTANPHKVDEMLDNLFHQPAMEQAYRLSRIDPDYVEDFIAGVKKFPEIDKRNLINEFYASYARAASAEEGFVDGLSSISGNEWQSLSENLAKRPNLKHLSLRMMEPAENILPPDVKPIEKEGFGKKIMRWFEKKKVDTKGMKNIAAGIAAAVVLTPAAMKLMKLTAKEDFAKIAKNEQKSAQQNNQDMSKVYDMNKNVRS